MFRRCACIALAVMLVGLSTAQAADTTLTLACQGARKTDDAKPEPISMSIIVNFTARIVTGFADDDHPVKIMRFDNVYISFSGSDKSSTWSTFRVAAVTIPICSADRCRSLSAPYASSTSGAACCARWR
jgi:hypothetical protein